VGKKNRLNVRWTNKGERKKEEKDKFLQNWGFRMVSVMKLSEKPTHSKKDGLPCCKLCSLNYV